MRAPKKIEPRRPQSSATALLRRCLDFGSRRQKHEGVPERRRRRSEASARPLGARLLGRVQRFSQFSFSCAGERCDFEKRSKSALEISNCWPGKSQSAQRKFARDFPRVTDATDQSSLASNSGLRRK